MEPWLTTDPALNGVLEELRELEPLFHRFGPNATLDDFDAMVADDFWEIGASGNRYDRELVRQVLAERLAEPDPDEQWSCDDFSVRELGPDVYLLTYRLDFEGRPTMRATIWRRTREGWQAAFHQGTVIAGGGPPDG